MLRLAAVILLVLVLVLLIWMIRQNETARIVSAHVINMDKSADRLAEFQQNALQGGTGGDPMAGCGRIADW